MTIDSGDYGHTEFPTKEFGAKQNGFQEAKQIVLEERVSMTNAVEIHKLDQGLFAIFDDRGSIRFASVDDPELVKFKTSMES